jgi:hypothetical protein
VVVSYENHPPVVKPHPDNGVYAGVPGDTVNIDVRGAFDMDASPHNERVFEGEGERPAGIAEHLTSVCVDLDHDGNWCEAGEDGSSGTIPFVIDSSMRPGNQIALPVRVCDDGRWNGRCYQAEDGAPGAYTQADCSACGYGQALIVVQ